VSPKFPDVCYLFGLADLARSINFGSRHDFEQMNRVTEVNQLRFDAAINKKFSFEDADPAFAYLWSSSYIGKIVIELPEG
jgi:hypothetical protein